MGEQEAHNSADEVHFTASSKSGSLNTMFAFFPPSSKVGCSRGLHNLFSSGDGTVNTRMTGNGFADCRTMTSYDIQYARWEACSLERLANADRSKWGDFRGLHDDSVSTCKSCISIRNMGQCQGQTQYIPGAILVTNVTTER